MLAEAQRRNLRKQIAAALRTVSFEPGELAYLALTSKPEHAVRDKLAWALTKAGTTPAREWRRCDLALLGRSAEPLAVVELKSTHTGDVEWVRAGTGGVRAAFAKAHGARNYLEGLIRADAVKARSFAGSGEAYVLLTVTHVLDPVPPALDPWVKYGRQLRRVADRRKAERTLDGYLARLGPVTRVPLGGGEAFGIRACVDAWLCGPLLGTDVAHTQQHEDARSIAGRRRRPTG